MSALALPAVREFNSQPDPLAEFESIRAAAVKVNATSIRARNYRRQLDARIAAWHVTMMAGHRPEWQSLVREAGYRVPTDPDRAAAISVRLCNGIGPEAMSDGERQIVSVGARLIGSVADVAPSDIPAVVAARADAARSGKDEWYTPEDMTHAPSRFMRIDLDP